MTDPARNIDEALDGLIPGCRLPEPANDNWHRADFAANVRNARAQACTEHQRAGAKMWWMP